MMQTQSPLCFSGRYNIDFLGIAVCAGALLDCFRRIFYHSAILYFEKKQLILP